MKAGLLCPFVEEHLGFLKLGISQKMNKNKQFWLWALGSCKNKRCTFASGVKIL